MKEYDNEGTSDLVQVSTFKYLGTRIDQEGRCEKEVAKRIKNAWRELKCVLFNIIPSKLQVLLYMTELKTTLTYGNKIWPLTKGQEDRICATKMRMPQLFSVKWEEYVTNESIMDEAKTEWIAVGMWCLLQWYSDVRMRDGEEDIIQTYSGSWTQNIQSNKCQENAYDDYR